jgi:inorganic pyrophosphatase
MKSFSANFWNFIDQLIATHPLVIDRPRGSHHPRYQKIVYPLDYGYLDGTTSGDGDGIDIWAGTSGIRDLSAVILTVDLRKRDLEVKILLGCNDEEIQEILGFHNKNKMRAILVPRPKE